MRITRNDIIAIAKKKYNIISSDEAGDIDYKKWEEFISQHPSYFTWYEDTDDGLDARNNISKMPVWAQERLLAALNKKKVYSTSKIVSKPSDLIVSYNDTNSRVEISIEKEMSRNALEILLEMSKYLEAYLLINGETKVDDTILD